MRDNVDVERSLWPSNWSRWDSLGVAVVFLILVPPLGLLLLILWLFWELLKATAAAVNAIAQGVSDLLNCLGRFGHRRVMDVREWFADDPPKPRGPPTMEEIMAAATQRYEQKLRVLATAKLDDIELNAARERAKQQYLRELEKVAEAALTHARGNVLYARLSDLAHTLGFELLKPSTHPDPIMRDMENHQRAEAFVQILLRRRGTDGMAATPLMEEWVMAAIMLYLHQGK